MKTKILGGIAVLAIAAVAAWNINLAAKINGTSDVKLANVEALADETDNNCSNGTPRLDCPIWNITYTFSTLDYSCTTGGSYKCELN